MEQLKIIEVIKTSNQSMEEKVKSEEQELKNMTTNYTINTSASMSGGIVGESLQQVFFSCNTSEITGQDNIDNEDEAAIIKVTINAYTQLAGRVLSFLLIESLLFKYRKSIQSIQLIIISTHIY